MFNFDFLINMIFQIKYISLMLYFINWPNFIVFLSFSNLIPLLLEISGIMCIVIICFPVCDIMNFEFFFSFFKKLFSYVTKKSEQKFEYLKNKKNLFRWKKKPFSSFCLIPESISLNTKVKKIKYWVFP